MPEKIADTTVTQQVELAVCRLDSLSILPSVAAQFLSQLNQFQLSPSSLAELIESEPFLSARIFSLMHEQDGLKEENYSIRGALDELPLRLIRDVFLAAKVLPFKEVKKRIAIRKGLLLHSLATACCARDIAGIISPRMDSQLAYSAGLLHDIGKFALDEAMPKSFVRIIEEAKSQNACSCTIEQKNLGVDHTILGKRLANKWHLPEQIALAIWLHHSDTEIISQSMPEARIAQVVQLADSMARQCDIGQSGSFDTPYSVEQIAESLAIDIAQLEQIRQNLSVKVAQKSKVLGLDLPNVEAIYYDNLHITAAQLAQESTTLSQQNRQLQTAWGHFDFIIDFLLNINSNTQAIEIAKDFATRLQKFYQTGLVCVYFKPAAGSEILEAAVVEDARRSEVVSVDVPAEVPIIPKPIANSFAILDAQDYAGWLFEQLEADFDLNVTKLVPLLCGNEAIGAMAFEFRHPAGTEKLEKGLKAATSIAGNILSMAFAWRNQQRFAEQFAMSLSQIRARRDELISNRCLDTMVEMAAGAAHELNNPLLVISGRAQMLAETESDSEKRQILEQIQKNTNEISQIIDGLMSFAMPSQPRPTQTDIKQILDEATQLSAQRHNVESIDIKVDVAGGGESVFVDSGQIVSAIANIFSNCLESYSDGSGPVKVTTATDTTGSFVRLQITDFGCGMDAETVQKSTQPFFSSQPAGRKRGMGLAYAQRLIQLNRGHLNITSRPGSGTSVTILLPITVSK